MAVDGPTKEKKKKKKIKVKEEVVAQDPVCHDVSVQTVVKKEPLDLNASDGENEEKKKKKKKKKVKEEVDANIPVTVCHDAFVQTGVKDERSEISITDAPEKTIKKKKRKTKEEPEPLKEEENGELLVSKKKKAKKKGYEDELQGIKNKKTKKELEVKEEEDDVETVKKKRKKQQELNTELEDRGTKKKRTKKEADECIEEEQKMKKKKKEKLSAKEEPVISLKEKPEKKSKKDLKRVDEGESLPHANGGHVSSPDKKMKKKKVKVEAADVIQKMEEKPAGEKDRKEERHKTPEKVQKKKFEEIYEALKKRANKKTDIVFLSAKPGNQDEVSIDQARRLALQRDIDKESQPKPTLGQWGTAEFDSSDRQAKFLRLMGGFKKSSQPVAGSSGSASTALGKEGQQTLQQGLLGEFERAQSRHMDFKFKGAGLGFAAPSNKKFTIDINARKSVRFDD